MEPEQTQIQIILKTDWDKMIVKKSPRSFWVNLAWIQFGFAVYFLAWIFTYNSILAIDSLFFLTQPLLSALLVLGVLSIPVYLSVNFFALSNLRNTFYVFESARIKKMGSHEEQIPAKLMVERSDIAKRITTYDLSEYKRAHISQSPWGMLFNFGSLVITNEETDAKKVKTIRVRGIGSPAQLLLTIQSVLDDSQKKK